MDTSSAPSEAQLELLDLLWQASPQSVRDLHAAIAGRRPVSYTTVLTQLQRMTEAGLVARDTATRAHVYRPAVDREAVEGTLFGRLAATAFGGSRVTLALRALGDAKPSPEELAELRRWIDEQDDDA